MAQMDSNRDNVNTMPMNGAVQGWKQKLRPLPAEAQLGAAVPDSRMLKKTIERALAYTYGPKQYGLIDFGPNIPTIILPSTPASSAIGGIIAANQPPPSPHVNKFAGATRKYQGQTRPPHWDTIAGAGPLYAHITKKVLYESQATPGNGTSGTGEELH